MIYNICSVISGMCGALNIHKITLIQNAAAPLFPPSPAQLPYSLNILSDCETTYLLWIYSINHSYFYSC